MDNLLARGSCPECRQAAALLCFNVGLPHIFILLVDYRFRCRVSVMLCAASGGSWPDGDAQCQLSFSFVRCPALGRVPRVDQFDACALVVAHIASRQREPATDGYCCDRAVAKVNRIAGCLSAREDAAKRVCAFPIKR